MEITYLGKLTRLRVRIHINIIMSTMRTIGAPTIAETTAMINTTTTKTAKK